jgi:hypothetical protein
MNNKTNRIDPKFNEELEEIQQKRLDKKLDKTKTSIRELTLWITKHNFWPQIKEEMINFDKNGKQE